MISQNVTIPSFVPESRILLELTTAGLVNLQVLLHETFCSRVHSTKISFKINFILWKKMGVGPQADFIQMLVGVFSAVCQQNTPTH